MNYIISILIVLVFSVGNFIPFLENNLLNNIIRLIIFVSIIFVFFFSKGYEKYISRKSITYFFIITILSIMASFNTLDFMYALEKYLSISLVVITLLFLFLLLLKNNDLLEVMRLIVISGAVILIFTIFYKLNFGFWNRNVRFFLNGSIVFAWLMSFYSLLSFFIFRNTKKNIDLLLFLLFLLAVIWAESKGALLSLIISVVFYAFYSSKNYIKFIILFFSSLCFIFLKDIVNYLEVILDGSRFNAIFRYINNDVSSQDAGSITVRQDMFLEAYNLFINNWITGIGLGNYKFYTIYGFPYPHNIHIEIFMECGVFIGLIYLFFIGFCFLRAPKIIKAAILLFFIAGSFSGDITYLRFILFMCLLGLSVPSITIKEKIIHSNNLVVKSLDKV